jgi:2-polyprenyl-3-methyl-5-hydroxy-6-metoxy-1,4-benzoquinol methylase
MMDGGPDTSSENLAFYQEVYQTRHPFLTWLHGRVSFDQQLKAKPNLRMARPFLEQIWKEGRVAKVLDYGCGRGVFLQGLPRGRVDAFCFDLSENAMVGLERVMGLLGRNVRRVRFDSADRIEPGGFDLIVCSHVIEHMPDEAGALRRFWGALRPGGALLVNVPINEQWEDPRHVRSYSRASLCLSLRAAGFDILQEKTASKWEGFLIKCEARLGPKKSRRCLLRACRGLLALLPYRSVIAVERLLLTAEPDHHCLVLACRPHDAP